MKPFCAAHRGLSKAYPENTTAAFQAAVDAGFPALEMDLRLTRDGEVVVLHDAGIERTTGGSGRVADMRYDELRTYDAGAGPVPRLDDLLSDFSNWRGLWDLEIKASEATKPTLELVAHHHLGSRAHITSMDPGVLRTAQKVDADVPRGLIVLGPPDQEDIDEARAAECAWLHCDYVFVKEDTIDRIEDAGMRAGAWTVNEPDDARKLVDAGIGCIITDVAQVLEAVAPHAEPEPWF